MTRIAAQLARIERALCELDRKADKIMSAQDDVNAAVSTDTTLITDLTTQVAAVSAAQQAFATEIANLENQGVDTSKLNEANSALAAAQQPLDNAVAALTAASGG